MSFLSQRKRAGKGVGALNLIPILDAIFIIIFFLLMSAQFIKFHEIASDAPNIKMVDRNRKDKSKPLNLTLEILPDKIVIKTRAEGVTTKVLPLREGKYDMEGLLATVVEIKKEHMDETSVILKPVRSVPYQKIIAIIDILRELPKKSPPLEGANEKGKFVKTRKLFDQVIFETII